MRVHLSKRNISASLGKCSAHVREAALELLVQAVEIRRELPPERDLQRRGRAIRPAKKEFGKTSR